MHVRASWRAAQEDKGPLVHARTRFPLALDVHATDRQQQEQFFEQGIFPLQARACVLKGTVT